MFNGSLVFGNFIHEVLVEPCPEPRMAQEGWREEEWISEVYYNKSLLHRSFIARRKPNSHANPINLYPLCSAKLSSGSRDNWAYNVIFRNKKYPEKEDKVIDECNAKQHFFLSREGQNLICACQCKKLSAWQRRIYLYLSLSELFAIWMPAQREPEVEFLGNICPRWAG